MKLVFERFADCLAGLVSCFGYPCGVFDGVFAFGNGTDIQLGRLHVLGWDSSLYTYITIASSLIDHFVLLGARIRWNDDEETALHSGRVGVSVIWDS